MNFRRWIIMNNDIENSELYYAGRWSNFRKALTSKFNIFMILLGILFLVDLKLGGPLMQKLILIQYGIRGIDVNGPNFTIVSVFGTYKEIAKLALAFDKFLWIFFIGITALSWLLGFLVSALKKT